jgi:pimeloyl-ACP methyl ester carboxylesterase
VIAAAPLVNLELNKTLRTLLRSQAAQRLYQWMRRQAVIDALGTMQLWSLSGLMRDPARKRNHQDLRRTNVRAAVGTLRAVAQVNLETHLSRIIAPTLIVVGERDVTVPPEQGRRAARFIPDARLVTWPDVGHQLVDDRGDDFDRLVLDQLTRATIDDWKLRVPI